MGLRDVFSMCRNMICDYSLAVGSNSYSFSQTAALECMILSVTIAIYSKLLHQQHDLPCATLLAVLTCKVSIIRV